MDFRLLYSRVTIYKTRDFGSASFNVLKNKILKIRGIEQNISERDLTQEKLYYCIICKGGGWGML